MKKLVLVMLLVGGMAFGAEYKKPVPPPKQPGDDAKIEITIGEARMALWTDEQYKIVLDEFEKLMKQTKVLEDIKDKREATITYLRGENEMRKTIAKRYRAVAIVGWSTAGALALITSFLLLLFRGAL